MKILGGFLKTIFGIGTVVSVAVQCCAGAALFGRMPLAAVLLFGTSALLTAGAASYFSLRRHRWIPYSLLFSSAALACGAGVWLMVPPVSLPLTAFGWFHLTALIPPLLALSGECFAKIPRRQTTGSGR